MTVAIHHGDCREVIRGLDPVDAVVCDPPYGLKFMGKGWDHGVPGVEFWDVIRGVMKPGAHLLAFGGTRTHHRLIVAIEDVGFEIRDTIMWVYGSGFPKSLDVGKAIDRRGGAFADFTTFRDAVRVAMATQGVTRAALSSALGNYMLSHYLTAGSQPAIPVWRDYQIIRDAVDLGDGWDDLFRRAAERDVVGKKMAGIATPGDAERHTVGGSRTVEVDITAPATDAAKQWDGWGTALKPAWEPIIMARKPLEGTVAANVLKYGVGGLNIDGCRVGADWATDPTRRGWQGGDATNSASVFGNAGQDRVSHPHAMGRWPANLLHDGSQEVLDLFPANRPGASSNSARGHSVWGLGDRDNPLRDGYADTGSAARFFYCAKASKRERGEGNTHPTVKPLALMRYLCRLVTPPGGTILDPFMGSGSTLVAAQAEGFDAIGIDTEEAYCEIAAARVAA